MTALDLLAEERIREALQRGELTGLPGEGKPVVLDDDALIPAELRMVMRVLKNSGHLPPEVETLRELRQIESFLSQPGEPGERARAWSRLQLVLSRLESAGLRATAGAAFRAYEDALLDRLETRR